VAEQLEQDDLLLEELEEEELVELLPPFFRA